MYVFTVWRITWYQAHYNLVEKYLTGTLNRIYTEATGSWYWSMFSAQSYSESRMTWDLRSLMVFGVQDTENLDYGPQHWLFSLTQKQLILSQTHMN